MKKITSLVMLLCIMTLNVQSVFAQTDSAASAGLDSSTVTDSNEVTTEVAEEAPDAVVEESGIQVLKKKFIEGGAFFMSLPLICFIIGLAIAIERIISLFWMSINTDKFVAQI